MTATDELRRLLDERGVEYYETPNGISWGRLATPMHGRMYTHYAVELDGLLCVSSHCITPEQAVEATLGRGTCRDANNRFNAWTCSGCGATLLLLFDDYGEPSFSVDGTADVPHYCPNCGRKVVDA